MRACGRFDDVLARGGEAVWAELEAHGRGCEPCRERLALWHAISQAAPSLRKEWESGQMWSRIEKEIGAPASRSAAGPAPGRHFFRSWLPLAAAAVLFVVAMIGLQVFRPSLGERELIPARNLQEPLLTENALSDVEKSEERYVSAIERLSLLAGPKLKEPTSPLLVSYREKIQLIDGAIADLRSQLEQNSFNTHLRKELLAMYQEKQRTLEQVVQEVKS